MVLGILTHYSGLWLIKMRILQINSVYKVGSTGKIVDSLASELRGQGCDVFTCYGLGDSHYDDYSRKICHNLEHNVNALWARISGIPYGGIYLANQRIVRFVKQYRPNVVHVHCVNAFTINIYRLLKYLAKNDIKTVVTLHAEFFHTGSCSHAFDCEKWKMGCHHCEEYKFLTASRFFDRSNTAWKRMRDAFSGFKPENIAITAVSPWLSERAKQSPFLDRFMITYVPNGINTKVFHYRTSIGLIDKEAYIKTVLFVVPYFNMEEGDLKGGRFLTLIAKKHPQYIFVVVAGRTNGHIGKLPSNVQLWGKAKTQEELAQLYSESDATILFSKRETFSMVTAESLCCGTPVVGFRAGGPESIAMEDYSRFVRYANVQDLSDALNECLDITANPAEISNLAISAYSQEKMAALYFEVYRKLLK